MLTCKEVSHDIAADGLATAPWRRRVAIRLHLMMCDRCRRFAAEIVALGDATRRLVRTSSLATDDAQIEQRLLEQLAGDIAKGNDRTE